MQPQNIPYRPFLLTIWFEHLGQVGLLTLELVFTLALLLVPVNEVVVCNRADDTAENPDKFGKLGGVRLSLI